MDRTWRRCAAGGALALAVGVGGSVTGAGSEESGRTASRCLLASRSGGRPGALAPCGFTPPSALGPDVAGSIGRALLGLFVETRHG